MSRTHLFRSQPQASSQKFILKLRKEMRDTSRFEPYILQHAQFPNRARNSNGYGQHSHGNDPTHRSLEKRRLPQIHPPHTPDTPTIKTILLLLPFGRQHFVAPSAGTASVSTIPSKHTSRRNLWSVSSKHFIWLPALLLRLTFLQG